MILMLNLVIEIVELLGGEDLFECVGDGVGEVNFGDV